jgi:uncharacterized protein YjaZ
MSEEDMNRDEYNILFHRLQLNLVAFKPLMECDQEVLRLVNAAIAAEREECAKVLESKSNAPDIQAYAFAIRERGAP